MLYMIRGENNGATTFVTEVENITSGIPVNYHNITMVLWCVACNADSH